MSEPAVPAPPFLASPSDAAGAFTGKKVVFVHSLAALAERFEQLAAEHLPGVTTAHVADQGFYDAEFDKGYLDESEQRRLVERMNEGAAADADVVVVSCSFLGPYVDTLRSEAKSEWLRVDEAMGRAALAAGDRIGVLSTGEVASKSTQQLLRRLASEQGREIRVVATVVPGAFDSLQRGDLAAHDESIVSHIRALEDDVDVLVLSQASMARALSAMQAPPAVPVLTSPPLCFAQLREMLLD